MHEAHHPGDSAADVIAAQRSSVITIRTLQPQDHGRWDAFVHSCPEATFFHRAGWQTIMEQGFGHASHFLYAEQNGRILGVLPLVHMRGLLRSEERRVGKECPV